MPISAVAVVAFYLLAHTGSVCVCVCTFHGYTKRRFSIVFFFFSFWIPVGRFYLSVKLPVRDLVKFSLWFRQCARGCFGSTPPMWHFSIVPAIHTKWLRISDDIFGPKWKWPIWCFNGNCCHQHTHTQVEMVVFGYMAQNFNGTPITSWYSRQLVFLNGLLGNGARAAQRAKFNGDSSASARRKEETERE